MSTTTVVKTLLFASQQFTIYSGFIIMFGGVLGHIINITVLTSSKQFRRTPAAFYLIVESLADVVQITIPLGSRIAINGFDNDLTKTSIIWCKLRQFIVSTSGPTAFSLICLACLDQFFATSYYPHLRSLSNLKLARRLVCSALIFCPVHASLFLIFLEIHPPLGCIPANTFFNMYYTYVYLLVWIGLLPIVFSNTFALMAYSNVRRIVRRQIPVFRRRLDRQLTAMILARVAFLSVFITPFFIYRIYSVQAQIDPNDVIYRAIVQLIGSVTFQMSYLHSACPFYVYMAVSGRFRRQVHNVLVKKYWRQYCKREPRRENQIAPTSQSSGFEID